MHGAIRPETGWAGHGQAGGRRLKLVCHGRRRDGGDACLGRARALSPPSPRDRHPHGLSPTPAASEAGPPGLALSERRRGSEGSAAAMTRHRLDSKRGRGQGKRSAGPPRFRAGAAPTFDIRTRQVLAEPGPAPRCRAAVARRRRPSAAGEGHKPVAVKYRRGGRQGGAGRRGRLEGEYGTLTVYQIWYIAERGRGGCLEGGVALGEGVLRQDRLPPRLLQRRPQPLHLPRHPLPVRPHLGLLLLRPVPGTPSQSQPPSLVSAPASTIQSAGGSESV